MQTISCDPSQVNRKCNSSGNEVQLKSNFIIYTTVVVVVGSFSCQDGQDEAQDGQDEAQDGQNEAPDGQDEAQDGQDKAQDGRDEAQDGKDGA